MLVLAGTIGAGKSSLAKALGEHFGTEVFYESVDDNPVLDLYYKDPQKYAFLLQIYFLNKRFRSIKKAYTDDNNVLDRSIFEDALFLNLNFKNGNVTAVNSTLMVITIAPKSNTKMTNQTHDLMADALNRLNIQANDIVAAFPATDTEPPILLVRYNSMLHSRVAEYQVKE